jgi:RNA polymerase sigma factor (TIGR02999 family)
MTGGTANDVTGLLRLWSEGDRNALDRLMPLVYDQLQKLARRHMRSENSGHTLRATELVHEAYLNLAGSNLSVKDRGHFYALASRVIRQILTNHGKAKRTNKRGAGASRVPLDEAVIIGEDARDEVLEIHEALERLEVFDPRKARIVELVFFGGLEQDLAAQVMSISPSTLRRELRLAKAWLYHELYPGEVAPRDDAR